MEGAKIFEENGPPQEAIIARPSPEDDYAPSVPSSHHRRCVSVDATAAPKLPLNAKSSFKNPDKVQIDTAAPFESVKAAVSKFGGIVDWKAHRVHTVERRKFIEIELEKAQEEMPSYKQQCEEAEEAKTQVLKDLESTKRLIEELKLNLERAQTEEQQAKQDSELAKLRVEEMEQGIADDSSFAAKAQLEVAKARHAAAVSELKTVRDELEQLRKDYALLIAEKDAAETKAREAVSISKEGEKTVENLTIQLITLKQSLDSEHSTHLEAEEHRIGAVMAKEQDSLNWELELKQAEEELEKLNQQMLSTKDLKTKLGEATALLQELKAELAAYMESETGREEDPKTRGDISAAVAAAKKDLLDVKLKIEKATDEVNAYKVASTALKSELEKETAHLEAIQCREEKASAALASLETDLNRIKSEIAAVQAREREERERMAELPKQLEEAAREADEAKAVARTARDELEKAKHEAVEAKAGASSAESKLAAVRKEIEAAKVGEKLALAAITAVEERKSSVDSPTAEGITLSLDEYYMLSKRAHEAEEEARTRVDEAISQIEVAKESELRSLNKLEEVSREISQRRDALETAIHKADEATQGKLSVEQELRKWRADHQERRNAAAAAECNTSSSSSSSSLHQRSSPRSTTANAESDGHEQIKTKKKKKSFFPRFFMFLGKRKTHHHAASSTKTD